MLPLLVDVYFYPVYEVYNMFIKFTKAKCYFIKVPRLLPIVFPFLLTVNYKDNITCKATIVFCLYTFAACTRLLEFVYIFYKKDKEALIHYILKIDTHYTIKI